MNHAQKLDLIDRVINAMVTAQLEEMKAKLLAARAQTRALISSMVNAGVLMPAGNRVTVGFFLFNQALTSFEYPQGYSASEGPYSKGDLSWLPVIKNSSSSAT